MTSVITSGIIVVYYLQTSVITGGINVFLYYLQASVIKGGINVLLYYLQTSVIIGGITVLYCCVSVLSSYECSRTTVTAVVSLARRGS